MTPERFVAKWRAAKVKERAGAQEHFIDLCRLLDEKTPVEADPEGISYCFEKGATKTTGGEGFADVWKRGCFGWEYKGKRKDLQAAFAQLQRYAVALENPPLLIVSDMERIEIHTNFTNTVAEVHVLELDDLLDPQKRRLLKWAFSDPERLRPGVTREAITAEAAEQFAQVAQRLRARGYDPERVAHFVQRMLFALFAEDIGLLPERLFSKLLDTAAGQPSRFEAMAKGLFAAMKDGGHFGVEAIPWFDGGLFDSDDALPLEAVDITTLRRAAALDWSAIEPSIFGTLFERGLDPDKRSQLGAHYTDRDKIMLIVEPVVLRPLAAEWEKVKAELASLREKRDAAKSQSARTRLHNEARKKYQEFRERLARFRVLDPACGSGNFLYLALLGLKDLEHRVILEAEALGQPPDYPRVGPEAVKGIEINPYAAELARVAIWIGEIQWMLAHGYGLSRSPILRPLNQIECRDALLNPDGTEAEWPEADAIIGNPPFLGGKLMRSTLGDRYVDQLFTVYRGRVPAEADLVTYWFVKAWDRVRFGGAVAGLVATNSIRGGANRAALDQPAREGAIFEAWSDEPWVVEGAAVRVSLICFGAPYGRTGVRLDGVAVARVNADLTASAYDLTTAYRLAENAGISFMGDTKGGAFDIPGALAREWLALPSNSNGRPNSDVLRPWVNGMDVTRRPADKWIIDFGVNLTEAEAALYEAPFTYIEAAVKPIRANNRRQTYRENWWRHVEPRPAMRNALQRLTRYIATPTVAKHRLFVWLASLVCPDHQLIVVARDDDTSFGILHSRFHELWSLRLGTSLEDRPRYTPSTTFETFPFPEGLTPNMPASDYAEDPRAKAIAAAAEELDQLRQRWLNPPELVRIEPEVVPGFPDRILPVDEKAAAILKKRTLTNLYNERPAWLANAHRALDEAVAAAYGWPADLSDEEVLARLLALNLERAGAEKPGADKIAAD